MDQQAVQDLLDKYGPELVDIGIHLSLIHI